MNTITCVCFDVWNTILQSNPDFKKQRIQIIAEAFSSEPSIIAKIANEIDIEFDKITDLTGRDFNCADRLKLIASKLKKDSYCNEEFLKQLEDNIDQAFLRFLPSLKSDDVIIALEQLKQKNVTIVFILSHSFS
jgi:putative hydrolase of the HAD superfamily